MCKSDREPGKEHQLVLEYFTCPCKFVAEKENLPVTEGRSMAMHKWLGHGFFCTCLNNKTLYHFLKISQIILIHFYLS